MNPNSFKEFPENQKLHIAIIMDGNGRWANLRGEKRTNGHKIGAETVRKITEFSSQKDEINELTLYAFSSENWKRPKLEVDFLMQLLASYLKKEKETYMKNGIRFRMIGDISLFSNSLKKSISDLEESTKNNSNLIQNIALNYGSQDEITRAVNKIFQNKKDDSLITKNDIESQLDTSSNVDILIRTGGDQRISNFLLWQSAYAELFFTQTLWPDFTSDEFQNILHNFTKRERRFGGLK